MGCCLSTTHAHKPTQKAETLQNHQHQHHNRGRRHFHQTTPSPKLQPTHAVSPPHPPVEEESVKEVVLSETPVSKPPTPEVVAPEKIQKTHLPVTLEPTEPKEISEASLVSESCEVSESFSYSTTTTITEVRDDEEAVSKRRREVGPRATANGWSLAMGTRRKRPNSGELAGRRGRGHVSPASKVERSSEKRNRVEGRVVRGRESGQVRNTQGNGGYPAGVRRDVGEVSGRRSRSPATRAAGGASRGGLARNGSKGTGRAGGRSPAEGVEKENGEKMKKEEVGKEGCSRTGNESLENPLVSLECFIFV